MISSAATSYDEIGNPVYPPARKMLNYYGINCSGKTARHFEKEDYEMYDYIICMDSMNFKNLMRMTGGDPKGKVKKRLIMQAETRMWLTLGIQEIFIGHMRIY